MQYIAMIHKNTDSTPSSEAWEQFIVAAKASGMFQGGSEIGARKVFGRKAVLDSTERIGGYMRFESGDPGKLAELIDTHPVVQHGGTVERCELPIT